VFKRFSDFHISVKIKVMNSKETLSTEPYKGVRDFYPSEFKVVSNVFDTIRKTLNLYGYEEYTASPLERTELYVQKTSQEIVNDQTYTFLDRGERSVTLRPEMTPTFARMLASKRRELSFPVRWFSIPNLFRYERPQRGRLREHYQLNVDIAGLSSGEADLEVLTIASRILRAFGAQDSDFIIRVSSRELLTSACEAVNLSPEKVRDYVRLLDKKHKISAEDFASAVSEITSEDPLTLIETNDSRIQEPKQNILSLLEVFQKRGITNVVFDPTITRGFDYYTGMVFEVFDTHPENTRSMFGGGRYDNLNTLFGGEPIPCVGFGMGDVTLMDFLEAHSLSPKIKNSIQLYIGTPTLDDVPPAQELAETLRLQNLSTLVHLSGKSLGDQIKDALKRGSTHFLIYGEDEQAKNVIVVKTLATSEQIEIPISEIASFFSGNSKSYE
jgi:histidyl-tRNA synthetase